MQEIEQVFRRVRDCFIWQSDKDTYGIAEYWNDFAENVLTGKVTSGDCEDFALTCLIVGIREHGFAPEKCRIARVLTEIGNRNLPFDHAVAIYDGQVLDNRQRGVVPISYLNHYRFYDYCRIPITEWYRYDT